VQKIERATKEWVVENLLLIPAFMLAVAFGAWWLLVLDREPPIRLSEPVVSPSKVKPGGEVVVTWKLDRRRSGSFQGIITREIVDSTQVVWRVQEQVVYEAGLPPEGRIAKAVTVPFAAAWGPAQYRLQACWRGAVSLTRVVPLCVEYPPVPFEIVPP
jgi:hypothetical protein